MSDVPERPVATTSPIIVTPDNFRRAETDMYFSVDALKQDAFGKFHHHRDVMPIDNQTVVRANRDTLYSSGVFDLDAGPVTITLPDAGGRFMSMITLDEEQYAPSVVYAPGRWTVTKGQIGTRYVFFCIRTFVDPGDPADIEKVHTLQDAVTTEQPGGPGKFEVPVWDQASQKKVRDALVALAATIPDSVGMFGAKADVDSVRHLAGTATGWGGNPEKDATYITVVPERNDGNTVHRLVVKDVPVDGFWSISVYNKDGYFEKNELGAYSLNTVTSKPGADGSVTIQFGGCDASTPNCIPITPGWNYWVRLYRPRAEILDGSWTFPGAEPVAETTS